MTPLMDTLHVCSPPSLASLLHLEQSLGKSEVSTFAVEEYKCQNGNLRRKPWSAELRYVSLTADRSAKERLLSRRNRGARRLYPIRRGRLRIALSVTREFLGGIREYQDRIAREEADRIAAAARLIADCIGGGGLVHVIGPGGHSLLAAEECFYRAGGFVPIDAILDDGSWLGAGAARSTRIERTPGYAKAVLDSYPLRQGEVLLIVNAYGVNAATIDAAAEGRARGLATIGVTSVEHSRSLPPDHPARHPSGRKSVRRRRCLCRHQRAGRRRRAAPAGSQRAGRADLHLEQCLRAERDAPRGDGPAARTGTDTADLAQRELAWGRRVQPEVLRGVWDADSQATLKGG